MATDREKIGDILKKQREEYRRYLGALSENFESQIKPVAESLGGMRRQLVSIREMAAKNTEDMEIMKMDLRAISRLAF